MKLLVEKSKILDKKLKEARAIEVRKAAKIALADFEPEDLKISSSNVIFKYKGDTYLFVPKQIDKKEEVRIAWEKFKDNLNRLIKNNHFSDPIDDNISYDIVPTRYNQIRRGVERKSTRNVYDKNEYEIYKLTNLRLEDIVNKK